MTGPGPSVLQSIEPRNLDAERLVLTAMLRPNSAEFLYEIVTDIGLKPEHFFDPDHAEAYRIVTGMLEAGKSATTFTLAPYLDKALLSDLCDAAISASAREVRDCADGIVKIAARRALKKVGEKLIEEAVAAEWDKAPADIISDAEAELYALAADEVDEGPIDFDTALDRLSADIDAAQKPENAERRITTGLADLDNAIGRFRPGEMAICAGRTSQGKTIFAMHVAIHNARQGKNVLFFSLEMSEKTLAARQLAAVSGVSVMGLDSVMDDTTWHKVQNGIAELKSLKLKLKVDGKPARKLSEMRSIARRMKRKQGLDFIVVDYLQIMGNDLAIKDAGAKTYQVGFNTTGLRNLAKELDVPILLLSQVGRGVDKQEDKRPGLSDLSDSSSIEKDSDYVFFIFREAYYLEKNPPVQGDREKDNDFNDRKIQHALKLRELKGQAEIIIAKARTAEAPQTVHVAYDGARQKLGNLRRST